MNRKMKVLVTGADQYQVLAVIRGLGLQGIPVIACGAEKRSIGFYSRFASEKYVYTSPFENQNQFVKDMLAIIEKTRPSLVFPVGESTLVALNEHRSEVERYAPLVAVSPEMLDATIDKWKTVQLAQRLNVPVPRTVRGSTLDEVLERASHLRFPVAIKPRGSRFYASTQHDFNFKVRYARDLDQLRKVLLPLQARTDYPLVQECVSGVAVCVSAVCNHGEPIALFPYRRVREVPLSGGVSVLRQSIPLNDELKGYVTALLKELKWHGVAMVEFKYNPQEKNYTLMEINPRFQASVALCLDSGLNLPYLVVSMFAGKALNGMSGHYKVGVRARWLRGDLIALYFHLTGISSEATRNNPFYVPPSKARVLWEFLKDFRPGTKYDEFKTWDWKPALAEFWSVLREAGKRMSRRGESRQAEPTPSH